MKQNLINDVIQEMIPFLNNAQAEKLQTVLLAREKNIPVKRMTVDRGEYELHASEVTI